MGIFKCKMCGGNLEINGNETVATCEYCGTQQTLPKLDDDRRANLYDRANHFRRNNEFDKAMGIYEQILNEDSTDAEAYWSLVLCRYGIEYVEDPSTHKRIPTIHRAQYTSIFDDDNYKSALQYADSSQRSLYEDEARNINEIQKGILAISQKEDPFDIFICYKETDDNGRRTQDSVLANDLYHQLTQEGFKVFYARITLEDKLGTAYEPYIFAALNSAKVMVVLGTKPEYFKAVWVRNEWSRFLSLIKDGEKKILIPAYKDMDPYDLPDEFSHLQAQDMSKLGFMQDLIRGIKKILSVEEPSKVVKETVVSGNANTASLLKRVFIFLEDENWKEADEYSEKVLDIDPECAEAYLGKLMSDLQVSEKEDLAYCKESFEHDGNYQKIVRFGKKELQDELKGYIEQIHQRQLNESYDKAVKAMHLASTEGAFKEIAMTLKNFGDFKDTNALAEQCLEKAEECRKNAIYSNGKTRMHSGLYEDAIHSFASISGWKDADELINTCKEKIKQNKEKQEAERIEAERQAEQQRIEKERAARKRKKIMKIVIVVLCVCIAFWIVLVTLIIPKLKLNKAMSLLDDGEYEAAYAQLEEMGKDNVIETNKYDRAMKYIDSEDYDSAYALLKEIGKDDAIKTNKYDRAMKYIDAEDYGPAYALLKEIGKNDVIDANKYDRAMKCIDSEDYDSAYKLLGEIGKNEEIDANKYDRAMKCIDDGDYESAYKFLKNLSYKDSYDKLLSIKTEYEQILLGRANVGDTVIFGSYEQDNNTSNGKEDIEWIVLAKEGNKLLLISQKGLDRKPYDTSDGKITWDKCSLRKWLNEEFQSSAFSEEEQALIQSNNTTEAVFLLSIDEAKKYFSNNAARECIPTEYAQNIESREEDGATTCWWWLRSPGAIRFRIATVNINGDIYSDGSRANNNNIYVRPAIWVSIKP